ncbi:hypothetical protein ACWEKM_07485 [Streptomyces sp. NPDC004752]
MEVAEPGHPADWTIIWTLEQEGRGARLFLVHKGFDPDDLAQMTGGRSQKGVGACMSCEAWGRRLKGFGKGVVKAVTGGTPPVHVHLPMHLHMNKVMIPIS